MASSDPDDDDILGENGIRKTNVDVDARGGFRTMFANRAIASETGRTFMRCWQVLSEAL